MVHEAGTVCAGFCGLRGWMPGVQHMPASEHGGYAGIPVDGMAAIAVVQHCAQGWIRTLDAWARSAENNGKSAHFGVTRGGEIHQYVNVYEPAWHAGRLDPGAPPQWPNFRQGENPNRYTVGIEFEGYSADPGYAHDYVYADPGRPWPREAVDACTRAAAFAMLEHRMSPSRTTYIGHGEIAPVSRRSDPGPAWPQDRMIATLRGLVLAGPASTMTSSGIAGVTTGTAIGILPAERIANILDGMERDIQAIRGLLT